MLKLRHNFCHMRKVISPLLSNFISCLEFHYLRNFTSSLIGLDVYKAGKTRVK